LVLLFLLFQFNDPWYFLHVKNPNFYTYAVAEFGTALFVSGLLIFWLRDAARHRNPKLEHGSGKLQKFLHKSMGMNNWILAFLIFFYVFLVVWFTTLYCMFYWSVEGNPGSAELSFN